MSSSGYSTCAICIATSKTSGSATPLIVGTARRVSKGLPSGPSQPARNRCGTAFAPVMDMRNDGALRGAILSAVLVAIFILGINALGAWDRTHQTGAPASQVILVP